MANLFKDPTDEEALCAVLRAYVEEWGPEHVVVTVPSSWAPITDNKDFGPVELRYAGAGFVLIHVEYDGDVQRSFKVDLANG